MCSAATLQVRQWQGLIKVEINNLKNYENKNECSLMQINFFAAVKKITDQIRWMCLEVYENRNLFFQP